MTTLDPVQLPLGKLMPRIDRRTLQLARYLEPAALPASPVARQWDHGIQNWGAMGNDRAGDCTFAAIGHQVQGWTANSGQELTISDADIIAGYSAVSGYDPHTGANDNGCVVLDVLGYWQKRGVGGHTLGAYAAVDVKHPELAQASVNLFGGCYLGVWLPKTAQAQSGPGGLWSVPPGGPVGDGAPGSWGGHAITAFDYDAAGLTVVTWGFLQRMTWEFFAAYCDEAYAPLAQDWLNGQQQAPNGFNLAALQADLQELQGGPPPPPPPPPNDWHTPALAVAQPIADAADAAYARHRSSSALHHEALMADKMLAALKGAP